MYFPRLSDAEIAYIRARITAGESLRSIAKSLGYHRETVKRIRTQVEQGTAQPRSVKLNFRISTQDHTALLSVIQANGLTLSEAIRQMVRQASGLLALRSAEIEAIAGARRELAAVGNNLNQLVRLGAIGKLKWNPGDAALVRKLAGHVDDLAEEVVVLVAEAQGRSTLGAAPEPMPGAAVLASGTAQ